MRRSDRRQARDELVAVIRSVRRRWRMRRLLGGLAVTGVAGIAAVLAAGVLLDRLGYAPGAATWVRVGLGAVIAGVAAWTLVRPLLRRVTDEQVALYLEEHEPTLEAAVLSALADPGATGEAASPALLDRTIESAIRRCHAIEDGRWIERTGLIRATAGLAAVLVVGALAGFLGPESARRGAGLLLGSARTAEAAEGIGVDVAPGDATISRGADAPVSARLRGFDASLVELAVRSPGDSAWERLPMAAATDGSYGYLLFDLERDTEYFVEADGVRSGTFTLRVAELPYVQSLELELVYPAYTGLPSRTLEGGDIAALRGTTVRVRATPTIPVEAGGVVVDDAAPVPLAPDSAGILVGEFRVRSDGFYHIVLAGDGGAMVEGSPHYVIDALSDGPPIVSFEKPGRDERATAIDEVFLEARAEDDYGVAGITLHYSVNGGPEQTVDLYGGRPLTEVSAGHTLYLEEFALQPGDLVSYYATASDNDRVDGRKTATSDLYFVQIRPFQRDFRAAESGPPQGGQPPDGPDGDLSERQRQIIAGTFNLVRDSASYSARDYRENLNTLALAQERLREQVRTLAQRMVARQVTQDTAFRRIAEILPQAADEMASAEARLRAAEPDSAVPPEQRALLHLQRAEAVFREVQVSLGQQAGGGMGGETPNAEDLADLFELELDKLRDQYETVNRGGAQPDSGRAALDETMERLEELARRQLREAERRRRELAQGRGTAGGDAQRRLADEVEEEARRLERLARDQRSQELRDAARRLEQAAESMRRSAAGGGAEDDAVERLRDARRLLERSASNELREQAGGAARRAEELAAGQESIRRDAERVGEADSPAERAEAVRRLDERKAEQMEEVESLRQDLRRLATQAGSDEPEAARRLRDAAGELEESRVRDKIDFSRQLARAGGPEDYVRGLEEQIGEDLDAVRDRLRGIDGAFQGPQGQEQAETLEQARDLARGLESMRERTREMRERASGNPTGPGGFDPRAARQYRNEAEERLGDARGLRDRLREQGLDAEEIDALIDGLQRLTADGAYEDPEALARVQTALADQAKRLEVFLRIRLDGEARARLFLSGSDRVPPEYAEMVEAYYRSLSRENEGR